MAKRKRKLQTFKLFTEYGIHIWAILIIANAALVYAFHFSTHAAPPPEKTVKIADKIADNNPVEEFRQVIDSSQALGPVIRLRFTVPGIGSGGGTLNPQRLKRNVTIFLYSPDENSLNNNVKPLYTIKNAVLYDADTNSPTYTTFYNNGIDLGADVKDGTYQLAFRTDESLRTLIKDSPSNIGGKIVGLSRLNFLPDLPTQTVLMGDTIPRDGDNLIDISDYNAFINCFGEKNTSAFCQENNYGDFDDNGVIDGIDYNILLLSFRSLINQGQTIPRLSIAPTGPKRVSKLSNLATPTPKKSKVTPTATPEPAKSTNSGGSVVGGVLFFLFLVILAVLGFLFFKNEKFRNTIKALIHLSPTGTPTPPASEETTAPAVESTAPVAPEPQAAPQTPAAAPSAPAANGEIEKDCYLKKKLPDDAGTGVWLTLTDDNGALEAHYSKSDVTDGFAKVKGVMKTENGKTYLEVTSIAPEE